MSNTNQAVPKLDSPLTQQTSGTDAEGRSVFIPGAIISIPWYRFFISLWTRTGGGTGAAGVSTGSMFVWPGELTNIPNGALLCNGQAVSRSQFSDLFGIIGVTYGAGDGFTTFNLPNVQDKVVIGASGTKPVGSSGGNNSIVLQESQLPEITPVVDDPGHAHGQQIFNNNVAGAAGSQGSSVANNTSVGTTDTATTGITIEPFGSGDPIDITPAYLALPWLIQT